MNLWLDKRIMNRDGVPAWIYFIKDNNRFNDIVYSTWNRAKADEFLARSHALEEADAYEKE